MGRPLNIKRKDGLGYWPLWCLSEEEYYDLTDGGDCYIHKHDQMYFTETELLNGALDERYYTETELLNGALDPRYYTETEIDATLALYLPLTGGTLTGPLQIDQASDANDQGIIVRSQTVPSRYGYFYCDYQGWTYVDTGIGNLVLQAAGGGGYIRTNSSNYIIDNKARIFGTNLDYSIIYSSVADALQIVDGITVDTNVLVQIDASGFALGAGVAVDSILDQDDFYSNSDTALATQQSIKAYIDGEISGLSIGNYALLDGTNQPFTGALDILMTDPQMKFSEDANNYDLIKRTSSNDQFEIGHYVGGVEKGHVVFDSTGGVGIQGDTVVNIDAASGLCTINATGFAGTVFKDEDNMTSNSATHLASQQSIKAYVDNKNYLDLGSILTSNGSYVGTKISVVIDDASTVFGNVLAQAADFHYDRADADAATSSVGLVLALSSGSGTNEVLVEGMACNTSWSWSAGLLYLSTTTGAMTQTAPSGTGDQVVAVGWALSATCIYFKPSLVLVEVA